MYHSFGQQTITDFLDVNIEKAYDEGYVFTRIGKGIMNQVQSLRIHLENFEFNSENRRILRKVEDLKMEVINLPLDNENYDCRIHKIGKDFYFTKNNKEVFSAAKIKELVTNSDKSNFNTLLKFSINNEVVGYVICYRSEDILHYSYPFYDLTKDVPNLGMGMIMKSIEYSKTINLKYFYLGSISTPKSLYKLQFNNMEYFDGKTWSRDFEKLKSIINPK